MVIFNVIVEYLVFSISNTMHILMLLQGIQSALSI